MLEPESSRRFYVFHFWKVLLHTHLTSLYKGHIAPSIEIYNFYVNTSTGYEPGVTLCHLRKLLSALTCMQRHTYIDVALHSLRDPPLMITPHVSLLGLVTG